MANRAQINLENDTANYRAHQSALALALTYRPQNTSRAYGRVEKEWTKWCNRCSYDDGDLVHEGKVVRFLSEEVVNRSLQTAGRKRKRGEEKTNAVDNGLAILVENADAVADDDDDDATLKFQSIRGYRTALINIWSSQQSRGINKLPTPTKRLSRV